LRRESYEIEIVFLIMFYGYEMRTPRRLKLLVFGSASYCCCDVEHVCACVCVCVSSIRCLFVRKSEMKVNMTKWKRKVLPFAASIVCASKCPGSAFPRGLSWTFPAWKFVRWEIWGGSVRVCVHFTGNISYFPEKLRLHRGLPKSIRIFGANNYWAKVPNGAVRLRDNIVFSLHSSTFQAFRDFRSS
jgi:hypothetical protein